MMNDMDFDRTFNVNETGKETPAYLVYMSGAREIWDRFSGKYEIRPWSIGQAKKGTNRGVEIYKNGVHIAGVHVGLKDTFLYVHEENARRKTGETFEIDPLNLYRITHISLQRSIEILSKAL